MQLGVFYVAPKVETLEGNPLAKLLNELIAENLWSSKYTISGHFSPPSVHLQVRHPDFLKPLYIYSDSASTVREVEDLVREHLRRTIEQARSEMKEIQKRIGLQMGLRDEINHAKARAAIVDVFPEATNLKRVSTSPTLCAFINEADGVDTKHIYAAREINNDFVFGVARLACEHSGWDLRGNGLEVGSKLEMFFIALARRHAAEKLLVPEDKLWDPKLEAFEKPPEEWRGKPGVDPYVVNGTIFQTEGGEAVVVFVNNLPIGSVKVTPTATIV